MMLQAGQFSPEPQPQIPIVRIDIKENCVRRDDLARFAAFHRKQALFDAAKIVGALVPEPEPDEPNGPLQRYHFDVFAQYAVPREDNYGEWVRWKDVKKLLKGIR